MFEIRKTQLPQGREAFDLAVQDYISKMHAFNQTVGKPRPIAHPIIEACVKRVQEAGKPDTYVPDYVVLDDTPPAAMPLSLEDRKSMLLAKLSQAEGAAKSRVMSQGKFRLATIKMQFASSEPEESRSPEQVEDVVLYGQTVQAYLKVELAAAHAHAAIEDLTEETIASWEVPDLG